jgi:hypothetical protein
MKAMPNIEGHGIGLAVKPGRPATLILGAGVSRSRGLPLWSELLREAWKAVFEEDPYGPDEQLLRQAQAACAAAGLPSTFVDRLDVWRHPFEVQFAFEEIFDELRQKGDDARLLRRCGRRSRRRPGVRSNEAWASELLTHLLRNILYARESRYSRDQDTPPDTLSLIAEAVYWNAMSGRDRRLISQVITFNVDDLLEREVSRVGAWSRVPPAIPIYRASAVKAPRTQRTIPIYHLHGFVPQDASRYSFELQEGASILAEDAQPPAHSLVFTDEQYWRSVGNPSGFASRVFLSALAEPCVFIGLSMTDLNIIRWLAFDAIERSDDFRQMTGAWNDPWEVEYTLYLERERHYWITEADKRRDPAHGTRVLNGTLARRGVQIIAIPSWESKTFHKWWRSRFLPRERLQR